jgi:hypothetical protein
MVDNPFATDSFINDTLEHLRQTARVGISNGDERQIEQTLQAIAALSQIYATIDYGKSNSSRAHAHLAASYLTSELEHILPHNMPDVLMEGARLAGRCAEHLLASEGPTGIITITQKLGALACCGVAREDHRPVTLTCIEQLAQLNLDLIRTQNHGVKFAAQEIRRNVSLVAKLFLTKSDSPLARTHSTYLGPYYSATSSQALSGKLAELANAVASSDADNANARRVIANFVAWSDGLYQTEKALLLDAINKRSQLTFDLIHWITSVTTILLALSNAPACNEHNQEKLRNQALWLISVLSFVPDDIETVKFLETFEITEKLYEATLDAHDRECPEVALRIFELLVSWMFRAGRHQSGWAILERSIYGLAVLSLEFNTFDGVSKLVSTIEKRLAAGGLPDQGVRDQAAREVRGRASNLYRKGHWSSSIERGVAHSDHAN